MDNDLLYKKFRFLVLFSAIFPFISALVISRLSPEIPIAHSKLFFTGYEDWIDILVVFNLVFGLFVSIGLFLFKRWARSGAILSTAIGLVICSCYSYFVDSGLKTAGDQLSTLTAGVVISMAYFSNISSRFQ